MSRTQVSRRHFLSTAAASAAALTVARPAWSRALGASDSLRVASVGVGGKGWSDLTSVAASKAVRVVALCDIDDSKNFMGRAAEKYPDAARFVDWRKLLDKANDFDAVIVSTPDHMHAPISLAAMALGKHVYCQKPLTHTVFEARQMRRAAERNRVVTQMGNQIQSHEAYRTAVKWVHDGLIGKVREVHSWQSGKMRWILTDNRPAGSDPIPETVHWDEWLGVTAERPYKAEIYHPFNWRAWQAFGTGQLGDFGCHILDPVFMAVGLTGPTMIRAEAPTMNQEVWNNRSTVWFEFPRTKYTAGDSVRVTWYDGEGHMPEPSGLGIPSDYKLPGAGSVVVGTEGSLVIPHVKEPKLFPEEKFASQPPEKVPAIDHYVGWADACRGEGSTGSNFGYSGPLTETVLLGTIAVRLAGSDLRWNSEEMKFANSAEANALLSKPYRRGWEPAWVK
ncbi:MAG: Gfo/Idh/MocA family oxidoreductase [Planctomycetes bacterium]|nr:Gfo/Idh/MocA family oxidoreductase [Planctomycetota bacterium]